MTRERLFTAGKDGYQTYRIPVLHVTDAGTELAFCESRTEASDWAPSALQMKRREKGGGWGAPFDIGVSEGGPVHNPCPLPTADGGDSFHLLYCRDYARAYIITSRDGGRTFTQPREITDVFSGYRHLEKPWTCIAIGPGGGVRTKAGRLLAPVWAACGENKSHRPSHTGCILSDDDGGSWRLGGYSPAWLSNASEAQIAELPDGRLIMTVRHEGGRNRRVMCWSDDGGESWGAERYAEEIVEPICQGSILRLRDGRLVYTAPQGTTPSRGNAFLREFVTAFVSRDGGMTWPRKKLLMPELYSGYTALAQDSVGSVICLVESFPPERWGEMSLDLIRFSADEVEDGANG